MHTGTDFAIVTVKSFSGVHPHLCGLYAAYIQLNKFHLIILFLIYVFIQ